MGIKFSRASKLAQILSDRGFHLASCFPQQQVLTFLVLGPYNCYCTIVCHLISREDDKRLWSHGPNQITKMSGWR